MSIDQAFNDSVEYYDGWMKKALPDFQALFGTAVELVPFDRNAAIRVLDLGAGTGFFTSAIALAFPQARFTLMDVADKMLAVAARRFSDTAFNEAAACFKSEQFEYLTADYRDLAPVGQYDLVISSLSIHHLEQPEKQALFRQIHEHLAPGGVFLNIDQIKAPSEATQKLYWDHWLATVRARGAAEDQIAASITRRKTYDRDASLADQTDWLLAAGFEDVDCVYKNYFVGVFYARKSGGTCPQA
jgi:tRNA (cmo5U34)-methyltransferase